MKSKLLFFVGLFIFAQTFYAQTQIPDPAFEQALIDLGYDDVLDGQVLTANIDTLTSLDVKDSNISDLTGIEDFSSLTTLFCYDNDLSSLDLSNNLALTELYAANNNLSNLNVSNNPALAILYCYGNELTSLDVSGNGALSLLVCYGNQLSSLDLSNNLALTELRCKENIIDSLDVSANLDLTVLDCRDNQLISLDVTKNTKLTELIVRNNSLNSLDVSLNTELEILNCYQNDITSLVLSNNPKLTQVYTAENKLNNLEVSKNPALEILYCFGNELTSLDVSSSPDLTVLSCADNQLDILDVTSNTALTELDCNGNNLSSIDLSNISALSVLDCGDNQLTGLDVSVNTELTELITDNNNLNNLDVSQNMELTKLICYDTQLTSLDVSNNLKLKELICGFNPLTSMDVSLNTSLEHFRCPNSDLISLNLKNGNNHNMVDENIHIYDIPSLLCVEVDDVVYSTSNWTTYVDDHIEFKTNCDAISGYTILAEEYVGLYRSRVSSGNVGVTGENGLARVRYYSHVNESVEASEIYVSRSSSVGEEVLSPADVELPEFIYNTVSNQSSPNVVVDYYQTVTLDGSEYGYVYVKYGGTVIFSNSNVNLRKLVVQNRTTIDFEQCTNVYIKDEVKFNKRTTFNPSGNSVFVYVDDNVEVRRRSNITASIYANNSYIWAKGGRYRSTKMNGMFIAKRVYGDYRVTWNMDDNLTPCVASVASAARVNNSIDSKSKTKTDVTVVEKPVIKLDAFSVKTWPVPSYGSFNIMVSSQNESEIVLINVYDINGRLVHKDIFSANNQYQFGANFKSGVYIVKINQASDNKTIRVIKN